MVIGTFGFFYSALYGVGLSRRRRMHSHVWRTYGTIGTCKCAVALLHRRPWTSPAPLLFYGRFKEHIRTLTLASARSGGCYNRRAACATSRTAVLIRHWYALRGPDTQSAGSLEYFLLQNRNHGPVYAAGVIDVYMHSKDNPSCIATPCMRGTLICIIEMIFLCIKKSRWWEKNIRSGLTVWGNSKLSSWGERLIKAH